MCHWSSNGYYHRKKCRWLPVTKQIGYNNIDLLGYSMYTHDNNSSLTLLNGQWNMHSTFQVFCSFELHIFNYFACTIYTSNILAVQLTAHIATLLMHLLPVSESGWISTSSRATIVDSCITFTVCWTATVSNVTLHVGSDTVGCTRVVVSTRLKTFSNTQRETGRSGMLIKNPF